MSQELMTLLQNNPALLGGLDEDTLAVAGNSNSIKRISIRGGVFRKISGGKEVGALEDRFMNVIIVKMAHDPSRTYYDQKYKEGAKVSARCWSQDSKTPNAEVKNPCASSCATCDFSAKGSSDNGTSTACRLSWRLAVVLPNDPSGDVMQLTLPSTSCWGKEDNGRWPFRPYIQMLASHNISAGRIVTKMQFDTNYATPRILFSPVDAVPEADRDSVLKQGKSLAAEAAIKLTVFQSDGISAGVDVEEFAPTSKAEVPAPSFNEPVLRDTPKTDTPAKDPEVANVVKKWAKK